MKQRKRWMAVLTVWTIALLFAAGFTSQASVSSSKMIDVYKRQYLLSVYSAKKYSGRRSRKGTGDTDRAGRTGTGVIGKRDENEKSGIKDYFYGDRSTVCAVPCVSDSKTFVKIHSFREWNDNGILSFGADAERVFKGAGRCV